MKGNKYIMKFRIFSAAAAILIALSFCSCSNNGASPLSTTTTSEETNITVTADTATSETAEITTGEIIDIGESIPANELEDFDPTKTLYYEPYCDEDFNTRCPSLDFLSEDLKKLYYEASYISFLLSESAVLYFSDKYPTTDDWKDRPHIEINGRILYKTGISYTSFYSYLSSAFTDEYLQANPCLEYTYYNNNNEVCSSFGEGGGDVSFRGITYTLLSETDKEIIFKGTALFNEEIAVGEVDNGNGTYKDYFYKIVKTNDGWKFSEFERWV